jgi:hypothetical protein
MISTAFTTISIINTVSTTRSLVLSSPYIRAHLKFELERQSGHYLAVFCRFVRNCF